MTPTEPPELSRFRTPGSLGMLSMAGRLMTLSGKCKACREQCSQPVALVSGIVIPHLLAIGPYIANKCMRRKGQGRARQYVWRLCNRSGAEEESAPDGNVVVARLMGGVEYGRPLATGWTGTLGVNWQRAKCLNEHGSCITQVKAPSQSKDFLPSWDPTTPCLPGVQHQLFSCAL